MNLRLWNQILNSNALSYLVRKAEKSIKFLHRFMQLSERLDYSISALPLFHLKIIGYRILSLILEGKIPY